MKLAISGKGGVGKTTLSAMLAGALAMEGHTVIALDADADSNLASALGVSADDPIKPLAEMKEMIEERTGAGQGYGGYFKLNPKVDDIPDTYARRLGNIRLLVMGGVRHGGDGCLCPAAAVLKALLVHLVLGRDEHIIMDMEAGIEHLGRATAASMDALIVVVDPGPWSTQTALRVQKLAGDIGIRKVFAVANRVGRDEDLAGIRERLGSIPLLGSLGVDDRLRAGVIGVGPGGALRPSDAMKAGMGSINAILADLKRRLANAK
ncbi:MAG: AAA family ATPase [Phycisphaerae bacterium]